MKAKVNEQGMAVFMNRLAKIEANQVRIDAMLDKLEARLGIRRGVVDARTADAARLDGARQRLTRMAPGPAAESNFLATIAEKNRKSAEMAKKVNDNNEQYWFRAKLERVFAAVR